MQFAMSSQSHEETSPSTTIVSKPLRVKDEHHRFMSGEDKIKSAVELALEKTAGMKVTPEDVAAIQDKKLRGRARGLAAKFMDGQKTSSDLKKELSQTDQEEREHLRAALSEELFSFVQLGADCERPLEGLEAIAGGERKAHLKKLEGLIETYRAEYSKAKEKRTSSLLNSLKRRGISGSAVLPNLRDDEEWLKTSENLRSAREPELNELRALFLKPSE